MKYVFTRRYQQLLKRLRSARLQAELTQADVAKVFGRPQSFVSKIESGERRIDPIELDKLAELYGKSYDYFLRR